MNIKDAYDRWSASYDADENLTRDLDQRVTRITLAEWKCKSVIEIGCGTGKNRALLSQISDKVHAVDISSGMLKKAREKPGPNNVSYSMADITKPWPFADRCADLIVCNLVLEHVKDVSFIFSQASRLLVEGGRFFICELHPFRQYQGKKAGFQSERGATEIQAFVHHLSEFIDAAMQNGFALASFKEWWHEKDQNKLPRLVSFIFRK